MYISIDTGGTHIRIGAFNSLKNPRLQDYIKLKTRNSYQQDINTIKKGIHKLTAKKVKGMGMGVAGILNENKSGFLNLTNIPDWAGKPLQRDLEKACNCAVVLGNDATAAAVGEALYGHGKGRDFIFIIWGTGIGGTAVSFIQGRPRVTPFEPGHQIIDWKGRKCSCGQKGCLETFCGGEGIKRRFHKPAEKLNSKEWDKVISHFAQGLLNITMIRPADLIILSGGIAVNQIGRIKQIKAVMKKRTLIYPAPNIKLSKFREDTGLYGALGLLRIQ
jgi:glucokinase